MEAEQRHPVTTRAAAGAAIRPHLPQAQPRRSRARRRRARRPRIRRPQRDAVRRTAGRSSRAAAAQEPVRHRHRRDPRSAARRAAGAAAGPGRARRSRPRRGPARARCGRPPARNWASTSRRSCAASRPEPRLRPSPACAATEVMRADATGAIAAPDAPAAIRPWCGTRIPRMIRTLVGAILRNKA